MWFGRKFINETAFRVLLLKFWNSTEKCQYSVLNILVSWMVITNFAPNSDWIIPRHNQLPRDTDQSELSAKFVITIHETKIFKTMTKQINFLKSEWSCF